MSKVASNCVGMPNTEENREIIRQSLAQQLQQYAGAFNSCNISVDSRAKQRDELAEQCNSLEEYKMRKAIAEGEVPNVSQEKFETLHDSNCINDLDVSVQLQPSPALRCVKVDFHVDCNEISQ